MNQLSQEIISKPAFVVDFGTDRIKYGLASKSFEPQTMESLYGIQVYWDLDSSKESRIVFAPTEEQQCLMRVESLIENGLFKKQEHFSQVLRYCYSKGDFGGLNERPLLIAKRHYFPKRLQIQQTEICFEQLQVPCLFFATTGVLSLLSTGLTTGICLEIGDSLSQFAPVYQGFKIDDCFEEQDFGAKDLAQQLRNDMKYFGVLKQQQNDLRYFKGVIKQLDQSSSFFDQEKSVLVLPDGNQMEIFHEQKESLKQLFVGPGENSLKNFAIKNIENIDIEIKRNMLKNFVLSGGLSNSKGIPFALQQSISEQYGSQESVRFILNENIDRSSQAWIGGSVISQLDFFHYNWISFKEFQEQGERIFKTKEF